ncbi:MAG: ABC transporter ATP-binding protein [Candidatus Bathyarchaeia archaeon]|jgi:iron complex transport system ATP-binding protein
MVTLNVNGVECRYGSVKVLSDITLEVKPGCFLGILGPNGSGKSTLLKSLSRVLKPHCGSILIDKEEIYSLKPKELAKQMAVVPQFSNVGFNFSVMDVVLMGRNPHLGDFQMETPRDVEIARKAMELTNTWHFANRPINELSGGEAQRVIIARALAQEPKILLLDEPISHLDIINQIEIMDLVKNLCVKNGLIVLAVIHDLNIASRYCDMILMLKDSKVFALGPVESVMTSANIQSVFGVDAMVRKNLATSCPYVIPLSPKKLCKLKNCNVHLICGAGTGTPLIKMFVDKGYNVTSGVLNVADTDLETCNLLKVPSVFEPPFSAITDKSYEANLQMVKNSNIVILTDVPFGLGNLKNLHAALEAAKCGILTYVIDESPIEIRDYTGGKATRLMQELKKSGAIFVKNQIELFSILKD